MLYQVRTALIPQRDSEASEPEFRFPVRLLHNLPVYPFGDRAKSESISGAFELMSLNGFKEVVTS